jgi:RNA polymerase sigma-70 factor (ECF subfamily)
MTDEFDRHRPRLRAVAYRMLGSLADAEDAVQETALRWHRADRRPIDNPEAWLVRTCTRIAIDALRKRRREAYVGPWLPEPVAEPASNATPMLAESLRLGFLLMLERLSPSERAAFLLREVFDTPYDEVAQALGVSEQACRQYVSRARRHIAEERTRFAVAPHAEVDLMTRFGAALMSGDIERVTEVLTGDARLVSDGGGKVVAALNVVRGAEKVARFFVGVARKAPAGLSWSALTLNGAPAMVAETDGHVFGILSIATDGERITDVYVLRNPDKLARIGRAPYPALSAR